MGNELGGRWAAVLFSTLSLLVGCAQVSKAAAQPSARPAAADSETLGPPPGEWYIRLVSGGHSSPPDVGPVPYSRDSGAWLSAVDDPEPTHEEFQAFYDRASAVVRKFGAERLPETVGRPYLTGDYFGFRSDELLFDRAKLSTHASEMGDLLLALQTFLRRPENLRWRLGYFADEDSLIVYPSAIIIGQHSVAQRELIPLLQAWLRRGT
jgi:hypothetical protein